MISGHTICPYCKRCLAFYFYDLLYDNNPDIYGNKKCYIVCFCKHRINVEDPLPLFQSSQKP